MAPSYVKLANLVYEESELTFDLLNVLSMNELESYLLWSSFSCGVGEPLTRQVEQILCQSFCYSKLPNFLGRMLALRVLNQHLVLHS